MENQLWVILRTLMFMGAAVAAVVCGLTVVGGLVFGRPRLARGAGILLGAGGAIYLGLLFAVSLLQEEATIPAGAEKYFCEIDCHLAYSVTGVRTAKQVGTGAAARTALGSFYVVSLKTRFDETTISSHRPRDLPLYPNPRAVGLGDSGGRVYQRSAEGETALASERIPSAPLTQPLIPGESYSTELVFDVPPAAAGLRLLLTEDIWPAKFVIGHENSLLHRKRYLALPPSPAALTPVGGSQASDRPLSRITLCDSAKAHDQWWPAANHLSSRPSRVPLLRLVSRFNFLRGSDTQSPRTAPAS